MDQFCASSRSEDQKRNGCWRVYGLAWLIFVLSPDVALAGPPARDLFLAPDSLAVTRDGRRLFVACSGADCVIEMDRQSGALVEKYKLPSAPCGLALSADDLTLFVTCAVLASKVCVIDLAKGKIVRKIQAGHTAMAPVLCPDNRTLLVCNRFNNDVSVIDLQTNTETRRIPVKREPVAAALTKDGQRLLVANLLPTGRADTGMVSSVVSVVDWSGGKVVQELPLPDGATDLNDIKVSPDGKYAVATHILGRYHLPANQVERGWMNANALTVIDLAGMKILNTVLLDDVESGAANPWGVAWSADGGVLVVTHAGTHEISIIDFPALLARLQKLPAALDHPLSGDYGTSARVQSDVPNDLTFLTGLRRRVKLPAQDRGPRAVVVIGNRAFVANYFSDTLSAVDLGGMETQEFAAKERKERREEMGRRDALPFVESIPLGPRHELSLVRKGEVYFNDASICYQGWQSCASCHPGGARVDGLNWDLPNDGIGNPKNTKSLLLAYQTPPCMSLGVRTNAAAAVRAGIRNILFSPPREEVAVAMDEYLKSLKPVPSPYLVGGNLSLAAKRGKKVFSAAGCADCHVPGLYTDLHPHDVGTRAGYDGSTDQFYTPTLIEIWRTAPYLHDGSAATIRDVLTTRNPDGLHGAVSALTRQEVDELCEFVLSL